MKTGRTVTVKLNDLKVNLFVRHALNEDHALFLAELMQNGVQLPPICITQDQTVIDGRHRIEACDLNGFHEIKAKVTDINDEKELISKAYKANVGGSLPPTPQDTEHTIRLLLERGESMKWISETLGLPPQMARKYIKTVKSKVLRQKLLKAATAVTDDGLTVPKAAERYDVEITKLKEALSSNRKAHKKGIPDIKRNVTRTYRSIGQKNANLMRNLFEKYEDGDVTEQQIYDIFSHVERLQKRSIHAITDWRKRFNALNNNPTE